MMTIEWEFFEDFINQGHFDIINAGPLMSPIHEITVQRDSKLRIVATSITSGVNSTAESRRSVVGKIRELTEEVELRGKSIGSIVKLKGVSPGNRKTTYDIENKTLIEEPASINSIFVRHII